MSLGRVRPGLPLLAVQHASFRQARDLISRVEDAKRVVEVHRTAHPKGPSADIARLVLAMLEASPDEVSN